MRHGEPLGDSRVWSGYDRALTGASDGAKEEIRAQRETRERKNQEKISATVQFNSLINNLHIKYEKAAKQGEQHLVLGTFNGVQPTGGGSPILWGLLAKLIWEYCRERPYLQAEIVPYTLSNETNNWVIRIPVEKLPVNSRHSKSSDHLALASDLL